MEAVLKKVRSFIKQHRMLEGVNRAVVAVSGGPDSVVLLDILTRLAARSTASSLCVPELHVAHLDHMLRGEQSTGDARFVQALAERYGLAASIDSADIKTEAARRHRGIEETARARRYAFLLQVARRIRAELILTGHTMNDQAETFLMRLARGSGLRGLAAMRPIAALEPLEDPAVPDASGPPLARPLLCLTREEVERYCLENGIEFRHDATNLDSTYTRNRIRHQVVPTLGGINPRIVATIARAVETIASEDDALDRLARLGLEAARIQIPGQIANAAYSTDSLRSHPAGLTRRMLITAIEQHRTSRSSPSGSAGPQKANLQITSKHVAAVEALLEGESGRRVALPGGLSIWREPDVLVFDSNGANHLYRIEIGTARTAVNAGGFELCLVRGEPAEDLARTKAQARSKSLQSGRDWLVALLDDLLLPEPLIVRPRRSGERALVLGQTRIKKLKKLMIDHKIPVSRRQTWPTVVTPDDEYVWSPGLPPSVQFAAHDKTHRLAVFSALGINEDNEPNTGS